MNIWQILVIAYFVVMGFIGWVRVVLKTFENRRKEGQQTDAEDVFVVFLLSVPICFLFTAPLPLMLYLGGFWSQCGN